MNTPTSAKAMAKTTREKVTVTAAFKAAVRDYQQARGLKSWSEALLELARIGLETETGQPASDVPTWGGWRGSEKSLANLVHYVDKLTDHGANDPAED